MSGSTERPQGGNGDPTSVQRRHVWVEGYVQGVGFRYSCAMAAGERGVAGWVRNLPDGRVEAVFEGPATEVEAMVRWCRSGPRLAEVSRVEVVAEPAEGHAGFSVRG